MKRKTLDELKVEFVGKQYNYLTVEDVIYEQDKDNHRQIMFVCKCKCGNTKITPKKLVLRNSVTSCGCLKSSAEYRQYKLQYYKDHKDVVDKIRESNKQHFSSEEIRRTCSERATNWMKDNQDKVAEHNKKHLEWVENNRDRYKEIGKNISKWRQNNQEKVEDMRQKIIQWNADNPEKLAEMSAKHKQWYIDNPDKVAIMNDNHKKWCRENKDKMKSIEATRLEILRDRRRQTNFKELLEIIDPTQVDDLLNGTIASNSTIRTKCQNCGEYDDHKVLSVFIYSRSQLKFGRPVLCAKCQKRIATSSFERELADYISTLYNGEVIKNDRSIISPYELDLYYPEKKIAIEFNGDYWHSVQCGKSKDYHLNKYKLCKEKGIRLISIFEHDYKFNHDKVLQLFNDIFIEHGKIYARNCEIKQVSNDEKSKFINKYHFDGDSKYSTIAYGLYYNDELISCMTFGKLRGQNKLRDNPHHYELIRFVTKSGITVIGGASKLFKHFIKDYNPEYILCYSDNDFFSGDIYSKLGFKLKSLGENSIDYMWVNNSNYRTRHQTMPYKLLKQYQEYNNIEINGSKENYIMEDLGYYKVYRCGNSIWEWHS